MAGFGFLEQYIYDDAIEEINGNSWNDIEIVTQTGYRKVAERFASPEQAMDMVKKMVRLGGLIIDNTNPAVDSFLTPRIRISAMIPPIVDPERGVVFSLRKQQRPNHAGGTHRLRHCQRRDAGFCPCAPITACRWVLPVEPAQEDHRYFIPAQFSG